MNQGRRKVHAKDEYMTRRLEPRESRKFETPFTALPSDHFPEILIRVYRYLMRYSKESRLPLPGLAHEYLSDGLRRGPFACDIGKLADRNVGDRKHDNRAAGPNTPAQEL